MPINPTSSLSSVTTQPKDPDVRKATEKKEATEKTEPKQKKDGPIPVKPLEDLYKILDKLSKELDNLNLFTINPETKELKPKDNLTGDVKQIAEELVKSYNELIFAIPKDKKHIEKSESFPIKGEGSKETPLEPKDLAKPIKGVDELTYAVFSTSPKLLYVSTDNEQHKLGVPVKVLFLKGLEIVKDEKNTMFQKVYVKNPVTGKTEEGLLYKLKVTGNSPRKGEIKQVVVGNATLSTLQIDKIDKDKGPIYSEVWVVPEK